MADTEPSRREDSAGRGPGPSGGPILQLRGVTKVYKTGAGGFRAINGLDLEIGRGEFLGIFGKSGAGKTTLLNLISGVSRVTAGEVLFYPSGQAEPRQARAVHAMDENELAVWRGTTLGIIYQSFELMPQLSLVKNVMLPQDFLGSYQPKVSQARALELLDQVELLEHAYKLPAQISGGQKQRVAIARALVNDPPVILADEPTGNLDTVTAETILQVFEKLVAQGKSIVVVTHDQSLAPRFSRRLFVADGELVSGQEPGRSSGEQAATAVRLAESVSVATRAGDGCGQAAVRPGRRAGNNGWDGPAAAAAGTVEPAIVLRNVTKTYVNAAGEFPALKGVSLEIGQGQFVSLVGKSGCGKSTLLNMLTGIDHPTSGEVIVGGQNIAHLSESRRASWRGRNVGIVFQFFQLLPTLTLLQNVMLPMHYCNVYARNERPKRAMELLAMVGLEEQAQKLPAAVSSGQQQSAAIARALATDPPILVADEPTGNLDSRSAQAVLDLFAAMAEQGKTILLVTHDPSFTKSTDQTVILSDGEIVDGLVAQALPLLSHPQMLQAGRQAARRRYAPGEWILRQGEPVEHLFLIAGGEVEIVLSSPGHPEISLACLGEGQFFGEVELLHSGTAIAGVRAGATGPVELGLLPRESLSRLLHGSPPTQELVTQVAQRRLAEHRAQDGNGGQ